MSDSGFSTRYVLEWPNDVPRVHQYLPIRIQMLSFRKDEPPSTSRSVSPSSEPLPLAASPSDAAASTPLLVAPPTPASSQSRARSSPHQTAAAAQQRGIQRIKSGLADQLRALETSEGLMPDPTPDSVPTSPTAAQREAASRELVDAKLHRYEALRLPAHIAVNDGVDLLRFWNVSVCRCVSSVIILKRLVLSTITRNSRTYSASPWMCWRLKLWHFRANDSSRLRLAPTYSTETGWNLPSSKHYRHSSSRTSCSVAPTWSVLWMVRSRPKRSYYRCM
jgi:hypothetical protein